MITAKGSFKSYDSLSLEGAFVHHKLGVDAEGRSRLSDRVVEDNGKALAVSIATLFRGVLLAFTGFGTVNLLACSNLEGECTGDTSTSSRHTLA